MNESIRSPDTAGLRPLMRGLPVVLTTTAATGAAFDLTTALRTPMRPTFDDLLLAGAAWALVAAAAWTTLVGAAAVLEVATDGRLALTARLGCRGPARRALLAGLGVALAGGGALAAGPVAAAPVPSVHGRPTRTVEAGLGLPVPARPTGSVDGGPRRHVVARGESLWRLSERRAPGSGDAEVARLVDRTYLANRQVIGPDPDLIRPGQLLTLPRPRRHSPARPHAEETP